MRTTAWLPLALLLGCTATDVGPDVPATTLTDGFAEDLTDHGGCGDVFVFAVDPDGTVLLELDTPSLIAEALAAGGTGTFTYELPHPDIELRASVGEGLDNRPCNDAVTGSPRVDDVYTAGAGSITIVVTAEGEDDARAEVTFDDVELESPARTVSLGELHLADIAVGWLPG